jgi:hypothetical protein
MANKTGATSLGMTSENFGYSRVRLRRVKQLQFGLVDPNELVSHFALSAKTRERVFYCFKKVESFERGKYFTSISFSLFFDYFP